jgi:hypothetical protein
MMVAVLWLDGSRAKLFRFSDTRMERQTFGGEHMHDRIAEALAEEKRILILGTKSERARFERRLQEWYPETASRVIGSEEAGHPSDQEIATFATTYLRRRPSGTGSAQ